MMELEKLEEMKRLENCFMSPKGEIDLMEMSRQLPEQHFRAYCAWARECRQRRKTIDRPPLSHR